VDALLDGVFDLAEAVGDKLQGSAAGEVLDGKHGLENGLQADFLALFVRVSICRKRAKESRCIPIRSGMSTIFSILPKFLRIRLLAMSLSDIASPQCG